VEWSGGLRMTAFKRGQFVEHDGLIAVIVGTPGDGEAPADHLALWYGEPRGRRISEGGSGGERPEVWTVPESCASWHRHHEFTTERSWPRIVVLNVPCSEPGNRITVAIHASRAPGR